MFFVALPIKPRSGNIFKLHFYIFHIDVLGFYQPTSKLTYHQLNMYLLTYPNTLNTCQPTSNPNYLHIYVPN